MGRSLDSVKLPLGPLRGYSKLLAEMQSFAIDCMTLMTIA